MPVLITVSLIAWLALLQSGHSMHGSMHYAAYAVTHISAHAAHNPAHNTAQEAVHDNVPTLMHSGWSWLIMLIAMMAPLLAEPIHQLWVRSLPRRRWMAISCFVIAYVTVWMLAGGILLAAAQQLQTLDNDHGSIAAGLALLITSLWQASPWKQVCLNRCHWKPRLSAFGLAADWDCLRFGVIKGLWCVGSCWALMFLPLAFVQAGSLLMLVVGLIMLVERWQPARPAQWRIPLYSG